MHSCYRHVTYRSFRSEWDDVIDACYALCMENSPREHKLIQELANVPVSNVIVQYNPGFKHCSKPHLKKQTTIYDLVDATRNAMCDALKKGYKRIMICEDDVFFDEQIHDPAILHSVKTFIRKKKTKRVQSGVSVISSVSDRTIKIQSAEHIHYGDTLCDLQ